ncbi:MAG: MoxR family ATPase [Oscillospiraceae bacterium]|nr:MoxR family ATPase [Oscillospiraceae bacterium]
MDNGAKLDKLRENIGRAVKLPGETVDNFLICLLGAGHVLLEDMPGTGKTTFAKALASSVDVSFSRIQCVPDILPSDITGINYYSQKENEFVFKKGPIFANIVLADEINRASPRSQSALLECMEEAQVTVDGVTHSLALPFMVIATQNPIETRGTFPLPEAQLDRFMMKLSLGYPDKETEGEIISMNLNKTPVKELSPVVSAGDIFDLQKELGTIVISDPIRSYIIEIIQATRQSANIMIGASPRAGIALAKAARIRALINRRAYVIPDDIKALAGPVLGHRLIANSQQGAAAALLAILENTPAPVGE